MNFDNLSLENSIGVSSVPIPCARTGSASFRRCNARGKRKDGYPRSKAATCPSRSVCAHGATTPTWRVFLGRCSDAAKSPASLPVSTRLRQRGGALGGPPNKVLQQSIAAGRPLRGLPLAPAAERRYVMRMQPSCARQVRTQYLCG
jgi:hypothetical protein